MGGLPGPGPMGGLPGPGPMGGLPGPGPMGGLPGGGPQGGGPAGGRPGLLEQFGQLEGLFERIMISEVLSCFIYTMHTDRFG